MSSKRKCPQCGKETRTVGAFCPYCTSVLSPSIPDPEENSTATPSTQKISSVSNTLLIIICIALLASCIATFILLLVNLPVFCATSWGIVTLIGLATLSIGLFIAFIDLVVDKTAASWTSKILIALGIVLILIASICGFFSNGVFVKNLYVENDLTVGGNATVSDTISADKVIANEVDANTVQAQEVITEKVTIIESIPTVTPKTSESTTSTPITSTSSEVNVNDLSQHFTGKFTVPADGIISGDCILNGVRLYDEVEETFLVFVVKAGDIVSCNWTAYYSNITNYDEMVDLATTDTGHSQQPK